MASVSHFMAASGTLEPPELPPSLPPPALKAAVFVSSASVCKWNMMIGNSPELMDLGGAERQRPHDRQRGTCPRSEPDEQIGGRSPRRLLAANAATARRRRRIM